MGWRITSTTTSRWVAHNGRDWSADATTAPRLSEWSGRPVERFPLGPIYTPENAEDEAGIFLVAQHVLPGRHHVTGTPPMLDRPVMSAPDPDSATEVVDIVY